MIGTQQLERDFSEQIGISTSTDLFDAPVEHREDMLWPRYVGAWCMSTHKRVLDLFLSVTALIFIWPLMVLIALLIRLTSEGPALFRQERIGLHQKTFIILKFRTMKHSTVRNEGDAQVTKQGDSRLTEIGALLRRLKLDELPQLINVARGEMSFVGPRPKIPEHENLSMACRPGITGAATIVFSHEESLLANIPERLVEGYVRTVLNPEKCRLDAHYIETSTFKTDLDILARTICKIGNRATSARQQMSSERRDSGVDLDGIDGLDRSQQDVSWLVQ